MSNTNSVRWFTLMQKEFREYKNSFFWTPIFMAGALTVLMLASIILAGRISVMGAAITNALINEGNLDAMNIVLHIDQSDGSASSDEGGAGTQINDDLEVIETQPSADEEWNFDQEWTFEPPKPASQATGDDESSETVSSAITMSLFALQSIFMLTLFVVTVVYLLGCMFNDRKDRSILFWKSMPISEWQEVAAKMACALLLAPAIYMAVVAVFQVLFIGLAMLMVWRLDMDPVQVVLEQVEVFPLIASQIGGWFIGALWILPLYAWLMLASAGAKRSPFMLAVAPVIGLLIAENIIFGTNYVESFIAVHDYEVLPSEYISEFGEGSFGVVDLSIGVVFSALCLVAVGYLRRYRFEI